MPTGTLLAARVDDRHWLTGGCDAVLPVIYQHGPVLMTASGGNAPLLMGAFVPSTKPVTPKAEEPKNDQAPSAPTSPSKPDEKPSPTQPAEKSSAEHAVKPMPPTTPPAPTTAAPTSDIPHPTSSSPDSKDAKKDDKDKKDDKKEEPKPGWLLAPPGFELRLRMSGLLWPEAADRIANSAYCTDEHIGSGQVILFAISPTFRAAARGTTRVMSNALICGPGNGRPASRSAPDTPASAARYRPEQNSDSQRPSTSRRRDFPLLKAR